jgi:hypothetical protein
MIMTFHKILVLFVACSALIGSCSDDTSRPGKDEGEGPFQGILEMDWTCRITGGDTLDFLPRPEGFIDTTVTPPVLGPPTNYSLIGACPNPASMGTDIHWQIPQPDSVWILAFDTAYGRAIDTIYCGSGPTGSYAVNWSPAEPGFYRIRMFTATGFKSYGDVLIEP